MSSDMVMPGDRLAASEEYMPGQGTYERDGIIYAAVMGKAVFSEADKTAMVDAVKRARMVSRGDAVLGQVIAVSNNMANVSISAVDGASGHRVSGETGVIHVSKVSDSYTDDVRKNYRVGDLVRARVIQSTPSLQLSSTEPEMGVLKARCVRCRNVLANRTGKPYCAQCERFESRKLAKDFGMFSPAAAEEY